MDSHGVSWIVRSDVVPPFQRQAATIQYKCNNNAPLEMTDRALTGLAGLQNTGNISSSVLMS